MNKKGFTLIELIFVFVLIAIIALITVPNISKILKSNKDQKYVEYQKILIENMKLYNIDHKEELWDGTRSFIEITFEELKLSNPDINLSEKLEVCTPTKLKINKTTNGYTYEVCMSCENNNVLTNYGNSCS